MGRINFVGMIAVLVFLFFNNCYASGTGLEINDPKNIDVSVEDIDSYAQDLGISKEDIITKICLRLRRNGLIPNSVDTKKIGFLYVNLGVLNNAFSLTYKFYRLVQYQNDGVIYTKLATVWEKSSIGTHSNNKSFILNSISDELDEFIEAYINSNQDSLH